MKTVKLNKDIERRINAGHLWIYSNEINTQQTPLKNFTAGEVVLIETAFGKKLAVGYINPQCLLCIRILSKDPHEKINKDFFINRLLVAQAKRKIIFSEPNYRLVFGESDALPGLVIDQFNKFIVIQINTAGMEALKNYIIDAVKEILDPTTIQLKCDSSELLKEGVSSYNEIVCGELPEAVLIQENDCQYRVSTQQGQKTGWYFDHRFNREQIARYCQNKRVLDVFSYTGAFAMPCAKQGAKEVVCVDRSAFALEILKENAKLNQCDVVKTLQGDALTVMQSLLEQGEKFDVIILDPPALIKKKKDFAAGSKMYQKLNEAALNLLNHQGVLLSASCSMQLFATDLLNIIRRAGVATESELSIIEQCHQAADHPIHPAIAETQYLKGFVVYKS